ncbi:hypothetical protein CC80DRAFT_505297 [Byssothecium circinans]|uniref:Uncharacterized protein n=1 Tax=Byssothecium circinans TaxID=147558 RepID=A0A6A5TZ69_9PLEO|nr:hypothetical protein CC80DRAFT_505297 [Byssothecium circinans]
MHLLLQYLALFLAVAHGAVLRINMSPETSATLQNRDDSVDGGTTPGDPEPLVIMYTDSFHSGTRVPAIQDWEVTRFWDTTTCYNLASDIYHKVSTFSLMKQYKRPGVPSSGLRKTICRVFEASGCSYSNDWADITTSHNDLKMIGWNDRIGSIKCKWNDD